MNKKENLRFDNTEDDIRMSSKNHEGNGHIMHADSDLLNIFWHCFQVLYPPRCKLRCRVAEKWMFKRRLY